MVAVLILIVVIAGVAMLIASDIIRKREVKEADRQKKAAHLKLGERLEFDYQQALTGTDKVAALQAGRAFYSHLRQGPPTIYDERAIIHDLARMS